MKVRKLGQGVPNPGSAAGASLGHGAGVANLPQSADRGFYLPSYSPELDPDEGLNADLKQHITRKAPLRSKQAAVSHMRRLSKSPGRVRSYFRQKPVHCTA